MGNHTVLTELFYSGAWHVVPVLSRNPVNLMRGVRTPGNLDPAQGTATLDNSAEIYAPLSVRSPLYGLIGQNTPARHTLDGTVLLTGEVAEWRPERPIKGPGWTSTVTSGVLRRLGRGTDPIDSAILRGTLATGPVAYWPLERGALGAVTTGTDPLTPVRSPGLGTEESTELAGSLAMPQINAESVTYPDDVPALTGRIGGTSAAGWSAACWFVAGISDTATFQSWALMAWGRQPTGSTTPRAFRLVISSGVGSLNGEAFVSMDNDAKAIGNGDVLLDGRPHHLLVTAEQTAVNQVTVKLYIDGVIADSVDPASSPYTLLALDDVSIAPDSGGSLNPDVWMDHLAFWDSVLSAGDAADLFALGAAYDGETAADRFARFCVEEGVDAVVIGDPAASVAMGPQLPVPRLDLLEELAATDDAMIFETRDALSLTMRTGTSLQNQAVALTVQYRGDVAPPLRPVVGDAGIRNDVTATSPAGDKRRVQQLTGPRNVQLPEDDPQGVGRYRSSPTVNPSTGDGLADVAGWLVHRGTFDGTWYAAIEVDLDANPALITAVDGVDLGEVIALAGLPVDDALDTVESLVIGREDKAPNKRRTVVFYCIPAAPYRVGVLALTTGDTDPLVGHLDTDDSTTNGATAAGAATFSVATNSGPLWTTTADDFPFDVVAGGQRVTVASIAGGASPQTFTVQSAALGGRQVAYPIPAGSRVNVYQPIILAP